MNAQPDQERLRLSSQIRHRAVGEEGVLVHLANGRVLVVNEVGLHVVGQLAVPRTHKDLAASIAETFDVSPDQAAADLDAYLAELDAEQVLEHL